MSAAYPYEELVETDRPFWYGRESLQQIYQTARGRLVSPWAVLAHCAANALSVVPPFVQLPPLIGGPGSLNMLFATVARSGGGKDAAAAVADYLTPDATAPVRNLGSGEGLVEEYRIPAGKEDKKLGMPDDQRPAIRFVADEVDAVLALGSRTGSTILPTLRSSFSGATLGASTVRSGGFHLRKHSYRLTLVMSVQPARAGWLLDDAGGGTPQRFAWFPARDPRADGRIGGERHNEAPLKLPTGPDRWGDTHRELEVPELVSDYVRDAARRRNLDLEDEEELDGHAVFAREKIAMALAVLDGRTEMTSADWTFAGIAMEVSDLTRDWVRDSAEAQKVADAAERGRMLGVSNVGRKEEEHAHIQLRVQRFGARMVRYVTASWKSTGQPLTRNDLLRRFDSRERAWFNEALLVATQCGALEVDRNGAFWLPGCVPAFLSRQVPA
ncbi:hypothetical protein JF770_04110 [Mycobacterium intracellulare]|uniref:hypothetical protein n=1 Tax=Mycobacterium intracellulare TaxID=1767 RepID=UPI001CD9FF50|nr:hypothetical protein [Mycobacterium intracellulare]MCA2302732.1 hypothetical protein [Mycobacterium intracellulare]MCA2344489.1 hypothetical protein [Mycobacterium intracellulare]